MKETIICPYCNGEGFTVEIEGECCNVPNPVQVQAKCCYCDGGKIQIENE